jgi:hypothetical protein
LNSVVESAGRRQRSHEHAPAAPVTDSTASVTRLAYQITSSRPALVDAEFFPGRETPNLASHGLRCLGSSGPEIAVAFAHEPERRRTIVSIQVPDEQPAGLYTGALLDSQDGATVGSLSLRIQ